ncbi:hypothetical protein [Kribbella sp. NPDC049584]|uniref:hypothetical protein n=1 Tax=Kribbella sp. NPDC049584 TaxID=3154833 RepID=UPI00341201EF
MFELKRMLVAAAAIAISIASASVASASGPVVLGGEPKRPGPSALWVQTPAQKAGQDLADWTSQHPSRNMASVAPSDDGKGLVVYWKGTVPPGLQTLAASQPVPVTFRSAAYSGPELSDLGESLLETDPNLASTWAKSDYSALMVRTKPNAPSNTVTTLRTKTSVPIEYAGVETGEMLSGTSLPTRADISFPNPVRPADRPQFYGGGLIRVRSLSGSYCSTGIALVAGPHEYMTTAAHCVSAAATKGTWVTYDTIGTQPSAVLGAPTDAHISIPRDIALIETNSLGEIWYGPWNTDQSNNVGGVGIYFPQDLQPVVASGGVTGTGVSARKVTGQYAHWTDSVTGDTLGPGFISEPDTYNSVNGAVIQGDSGSPVVASYNGGYHVFGFVSKGYLSPIGTLALEAPAHPGWSCGNPGPCYSAWYSVYAQSAINDPFDGLTVQTG